MNSPNTKLDRRITVLLISITLLAYIPKIFASPSTPYMPWINSLVTLVNLSVLFSTSLLERFFQNKFCKFFLALVCALIIFAIICKFLSPVTTDTILNVVFGLSLCLAFYSNGKWIQIEDINTCSLTP